MSDPADANDPAALAIWRACLTIAENDPPSHGEAMIAAVREAFAPIRALHQPGRECKCGDCEVDVWCEHCGHAWPCPTARLCYPSDELGGDQ